LAHHLIHLSDLGSRPQVLCLEGWVLHLPGMTVLVVAGVEHLGYLAGGLSWGH
jgi:hypothetical protein